MEDSLRIIACWWSGRSWDCGPTWGCPGRSEMIRDRGRAAPKEGGPTGPPGRFRVKAGGVLPPDGRAGGAIGSPSVGDCDHWGGLCSLCPILSRAAGGRNRVCSAGALASRFARGRAGRRVADFRLVTLVGGALEGSQSPSSRTSGGPFPCVAAPSAVPPGRRRGTESPRPRPWVSKKLGPAPDVHAWGYGVASPPGELGARPALEDRSVRACPGWQSRGEKRKAENTSPPKGGKKVEKDEPKDKLVPDTSKGPSLAEGEFEMNARMWMSGGQVDPDLEQAIYVNKTLDPEMKWGNFVARMRLSTEIAKPTVAKNFRRIISGCLPLTRCESSNVYARLLVEPYPGEEVSALEDTYANVIEETIKELTRRNNAHEKGRIASHKKRDRLEEELERCKKEMADQKADYEKQLNKLRTRVASLEMRAEVEKTTPPAPNTLMEVEMTSVRPAECRDSSIQTEGSPVVEKKVVKGDAGLATLDRKLEGMAREINSLKSAMEKVSSLLKVRRDQTEMETTDRVGGGNKPVLPSSVVGGKGVPSSRTYVAVTEGRECVGPGEPPTRKVGDRRGRRTRTLVSPRTAAVIITAPSGNRAAYAKIVRTAREKMSLADFGMTSLSLVTALLRGRTGWRPDLERFLREGTSYRCAHWGAGRLILSVTKNEVVEALSKMGRCSPGKVRVGEIRRPPRGLGTVWAQCPISVANAAIEEGGVEMGWVKARLEVLRPRPLRCFRCLEVGHTKLECASSVDRGSWCYQFGDVGHRANLCRAASPRCPLCADSGAPAGHWLGGERCAGVRGGEGDEGRWKRRFLFPSLGRVAAYAAARPARDRVFCSLGGGARAGPPTVLLSCPSRVAGRSGPGARAPYPPPWRARGEKALFTAFLLPSPAWGRALCHKLEVLPVERSSTWNTSVNGLSHECSSSWDPVLLTNCCQCELHAPVQRLSVRGLDDEGCEPQVSRQNRGVPFITAQNVLESPAYPHGAVLVQKWIEALELAPPGNWFLPGENPQLLCMPDGLRDSNPGPMCLLQFLRRQGGRGTLLGGASAKHSKPPSTPSSDTE
ncbi:hypothetical protein DBV15_12215 [Temnothorax longispinosus]|uniref:CCHC-type domain-containing protein n=1 Tax=Temnothorax longispinosus TaxID=300112 RepID=A0A4S2JA24_9HYME|nr:hypothetical protein DBV15_12215 [Temnothorax longispinosus]